MQSSGRKEVAEAVLIAALTTAVTGLVNIALCEFQKARKAARKRRRKGSDEAPKGR